MFISLYVGTYLLLLLLIGIKLLEYLNKSHSFDDFGKIVYRQRKELPLLFPEFSIQWLCIENNSVKVEKRRF